MFLSPENLASSGSEDAHCKALMQQIALHIKLYPQLKFFAHIPNGGARDLREGAKFRAMGVKRGFPDYTLPFAVKAYHGLYIELKIESRRKEKNGGCSQDQLDYLAYLNIAGYKAVVCYGWQEAWQAIEEYLK